MEVTNITILRSIKTRLEKAKGLLIEALPSLLWEHRTTPKTSKTSLLPHIQDRSRDPDRDQTGLIPGHTFDVEANEDAARQELDLLEEKRDVTYLWIVA